MHLLILVSIYIITLHLSMSFEKLLVFHPGHLWNDRNKKNVTCKLNASSLDMTHPSKKSIVVTCEFVL